MEKRVLFATILSVLILLAWAKYYGPQPPVPAQQQIAQPAASAGESKKTETTQPAIQNQKPVASSPAKSAPDTSKDIPLSINQREVVFNTRGAGIKHWIWKEEKIRDSAFDFVFDTSSPILTSQQYFTYSGEKTDAYGNKEISFIHKDKNISLKKIFFIKKDSYIHNIYFSWENSSPRETTLSLTLGPGLGIEKKEEPENPGQTRAIGFHGKLLEKLKKGTYPNDWSWVAVDNRYFLLAIWPKSKDGQEEIRVDSLTAKKVPGITISRKFPENKQGEFSYEFYLGPKKYDVLKKQGIGLEESINLGMWAFIAKYIFYALNFFYKLCGNYGWAIIILSVLLQLCLTPLSWKSFQAQNGMKKLQPYINDLRTKYKNEPQRIQVEMVHLYKTHKVNPLSGCLPMLLQIPIFYALFIALRNNYELRYASFLWIPDLSTYESSLIHILPILMGISMFLQQKVMAPMSDPSQAKMVYIMPVMMTVLFWNFPSGLVIYWFISGLVSFLEQVFIFQMIENKK